MQSNTDNNIQLNPLVDRNINQQELIFGHSKYLFYDSNQMDNIPKSRQAHRSNTGVANMKKIQSKINYSVSRPQTTVNKTRENMRPRNFKKKSNVSKQNDKFVININFKIQNSQKEQQKSLEVSSIKNPAKNITERSKNQVSSSRSINSSIFNKKKPQTAIIKSPKSDKSKAKVKSKTQVIKQKQKSIKQIKIHQEQKQLLPNSGREVQTINQSLLKLNHERIKQFFGTHHQFFKINQDYLHFDGQKQDDLRTQLGIYPIQAEKKLQQEIKNLISPKNTIYNHNQKSQNPSLIYGVNSKFFTNSFFAQPGIQRASILQYIKNSSTKKLFSILVSQNNPNENKVTDRYIDPQFNHEKINKINDCNVEWMYIKPGLQTRIFPDNKYHSQSIKRKTYAQSSKKQMLFVKFIRFLYFYEPEFISRLFQPAINNVYSVWFFMNGCYEPIFIDGYFPLDEKLNHLYGSSGEFLWLPILIKCICKMKDTYCSQILSQITLNQIYKLLTGMELQHLQRKLQEQTDEKLYKRVLKYISKGNIPLIFSSKTKSFQIINLALKSSTDLISYNPITQQSNPITQNFDRSQQIIILPPFLNWFIYFLPINKNSLNKFEIFCQRNIEFILSTGQNEQKKQRKQKRIYIYECEQSENRKKSIKTKLILKHEAKFFHSFSSKLKRGSYKIFIEQGEKKIHLLLSDKKTVKWQQKDQECIPIAISLFTTQQVKISEIEQLQCRGKFLEDSQNIYQKKKQD